MKAIIVKRNEKVVCCEVVAELPINEFTKLKEQCEKNIRQEEKEKNDLQDKVKTCEKVIKELQEQVKDLYHQIAVDRGEEEQ